MVYHRSTVRGTLAVRKVKPSRTPASVSTTFAPSRIQPAKADPSADVVPLMVTVLSGPEPVLKMRSRLRTADLVEDEILGRGDPERHMDAIVANRPRLGGRIGRDECGASAGRPGPGAAP